MLDKVIKEFSNHINKVQDDWFTDILVKHCSPDFKGKKLSKVDIRRIQDQYDLDAYTKEDVTKVTVNGELVGYWSRDYKWSNTDGKLILHIDKWVK